VHSTHEEGRVHTVKGLTVELELTKELNIRLLQSGIHVFSILYYTCFTRVILRIITFWVDTNTMITIDGFG
jgi:hypothetical protein